MTWDALIQFGRIYNNSLLDGPPRFTGTLYMRDSLSFLPAETDIPLVCDHDRTREIGRVTTISEVEQPDGRWYAALATVTEKPAWLTGNTGASFEYIVLHRMELNGWELVRRGLVREVTVTSPTHEPRDSGARVLTINPTPAKPAAAQPAIAAATPPVLYRTPTSARTAAEDAEMRRRLDWLEQHTGRYDLEAVVLGMQRELNGPSLDDLAALSTPRTTGTSTTTTPAPATWASATLDAISRPARTRRADTAVT